MRSIFVTNAFSINMLSAIPHEVGFRPISAETAADFLRENGWESAIGHADTAAVVSGLLGIDIPANRTTVRLGHGDCAIVAQYSGPRLQEGTTSLPEGAKIQFWTVNVREGNSDPTCKYCGATCPGAICPMCGEGQ